MVPFPIFRASKLKLFCLNIGYRKETESQQILVVYEVIIKNFLGRPEPGKSEDDTFVSAGHLDGFWKKKVGLGAEFARRG